MSISKQEVEKIAKLSRLALSENEKQALNHDLNGILKWVEKLKAIDTSNVAPMVGITQHIADLREDKVQETPGADVILKNAPARTLDFFTITKVVE